RGCRLPLLLPLRPRVLEPARRGPQRVLERGLGRRPLSGQAIALGAQRLDLPAQRSERLGLALPGRRLRPGRRHVLEQPIALRAQRLELLAQGPKRLSLALPTRRRVLEQPIA